MVIEFLVILTISMYITNIKLKSNQSEISNEKHAGYLLASVGVGMVLDIIITVVKLDVPVFIYLLAGILEIILCIFINTKRQQDIEKKHKSTKEVLQCLVPITRMKEVPEDLEQDFGFELEYDKKGYLCKIKCSIDDPEKWSDGAITKVLFNLNKFLNEKRWINHTDYPNLECIFEGTKLPPTMARYPGSFLRPDNLIPLGVTSDCEVSWNLGVNKKEAGDSLFYYEGEHPERAKSIIPPKAPQALVAGSTGGGKAIFIKQRIKILEEN